MRVPTPAAPAPGCPRSRCRRATSRLGGMSVGSVSGSFSFFAIATSSARTSSAVCGGNSGMCTSSRPWRFRSTSSRVGTRRREDPQDAAAVARVGHFFGEHRIDAARQPAIAVADSRLPAAWSASSTKTTTWPSARRTAKIFSRFDSVAPTQRSRKFLNTTHGIPSSPAQHWTMNVLPVPMRPAIKIAHRQRVKRALAQQLRVVSQPGLHGVVPGHIVQQSTVPAASWPSRLHLLWRPSCRCGS